MRAKLPPLDFPPIGPPTPTSSFGKNTMVTCSDCGRQSTIDRAGLTVLVERGLGDRPMLELPLRCSGCGSRKYTLLVTPELVPFTENWKKHRAFT